MNVEFLPPPTPSKNCKKLGFEVLVETGAGERANFDDRLYTSAGCKIVENREKLWQEGNIILKVRPPEPEEIELLTEDKTLISFIYPAQNPDLLAQLAEKKSHGIRHGCSASY